jgi:hypothetical protein
VSRLLACTLDEEVIVDGKSRIDNDDAAWQLVRIEFSKLRKKQSINSATEDATSNMQPWQKMIETVAAAHRAIICC